MNIFHFFAIDFCEWARPGGGAATGQNRPKYGGFPPACGARGAGRRGRASPPRAGPDRWEKYTGTAGFWPPQGGGVDSRGGGRAKSVSARGRTARAGFPRAQARTDGKSMPVRQGFGRRGAGARGRARKNSQRARGGGRTKLVSARGRARKNGQRAGRDGAGGLPPRAGPDRWKKYAGTAGFWPPRGGRAGAGGGHGAAAASLRRRGNRRGTGRRRAGRRRKIGQRAKRSGRTAGKSRAQDGGQGVVGRRRARL